MGVFAYLLVSCSYCQSAVNIATSCVSQALSSSDEDEPAITCAGFCDRLSAAAVPPIEDEEDPLTSLVDAPTIDVKRQMLEAQYPFCEKARGNMWSTADVLCIGNEGIVQLNFSTLSTIVLRNWGELKGTSQYEVENRWAYFEVRPYKRDAIAVADMVREGMASSRVVLGDVEESLLCYQKMICITAFVMPCLESCLKLGRVLHEDHNSTRAYNPHPL